MKRLSITLLVWLVLACGEHKQLGYSLANTIDGNYDVIVEGNGGSVDTIVFKFTYQYNDRHEALVSQFMNELDTLVFHSLTGKIFQIDYPNRTDSAWIEAHGNVLKDGRVSWIAKSWYISNINGALISPYENTYTTVYSVLLPE